MITLEEVNRINYWDVIDLNVEEGQKEYMVSNAISMGQAKVQQECMPLAIYKEEQLVGFSMYCLDEDDKEYWIYRLMIDREYQRKGYGKQAMRLLLERIQKDSYHHMIYLGVHKENTAAIRLYESFGFIPDGREFGQEIVYILNY